MRSPFHSNVFPGFVAAFLVTVVPVLVPACGGGASAPRPAEETAGTDPGGGGGGSGILPPPAPPQTPIWNPQAASYGRTALFGSFSSDLVRYGDTLFAVDADEVGPDGARILAFDVSALTASPSGAFQTTTVLPAHLRTSAGQPADLDSPVGFGFYLNDVHVVDDTLAFVLVNAGGSDSVPTLSNVVAFDPSTGTVLQAVDLANLYGSQVPCSDSIGRPVPGDMWVQAGAEGLAYVRLSSTRGRLLVAMSNLLFGAPSYGTVKLPGTVQVLDVDRDRALPLAYLPEGGQRTRTIVTHAFNPVAVVTTNVDAGGGVPATRILVTLAGTTAFDGSGHLLPFTSSAVEAYDAESGAWLHTFDLGLAGLSAVRPALGRDAEGHRIGFFPSAVTGELYLLRLDGLFEDVLDPTRLAVLRGPQDGIPVTAARAGGPGGNLTGVALSPDGRLLAVTGFGDLFASPQQPGRLYLLTLPEDVIGGSGFGASFTPGSTEFASAAGRTLGNVVLVPNDGDRPDVFVNLSGTLDASYFGSGFAGLGTLQTFGLVR